jgi:hypothetical protein
MQKHPATFSRESVDGDGRSGKQDGPAAGVRNSDPSVLVGDRVFSNLVKLVTTLALKGLSRRRARAAVEGGSAPGDSRACEGVKRAGRRHGEDGVAAGVRERDQVGTDDLVAGTVGNRGGGLNESMAARGAEGLGRVPVRETA